MFQILELLLDMNKINNMELIMNQEQKDYLQSMKTVFKESKEYVKNYQINEK